jgi:hypothetical protein
MARRGRIALFLIVADANTIVDPHGAILGTSERHFDDNIERIAPIGDGPQQHRQADARDHLHLTWLGQFVAAIGRSAALHVGDDEHAAAVIETLDRVTGQRLHFAQILVRRHIDRLEALGGATKYMRASGDESLTKWRVCHQKDAYHAAPAAIKVQRGAIDCTLCTAGAGLGIGLFDRLDEHRSDIETGLLFDFLKTGRTSDVDLGEKVTDHVQPH